ncbi:OmpP1/FadL family transporter [Pelagibaculum spongiae]|nr:outer membrane protein transport protein [Pelagibaculum spongiae]
MQTDNDKTKLLRYKAIPLLIASLSGALLCSTSAQGQGFYVDEQSSRRLGDAFSGGAAEAADASTLFYNPAGLTRLHESELISNLSMVSANSKIRGDSFIVNKSGDQDTTFGKDADGKDIVSKSSKVEGSKNGIDSLSVIPSIYLAIPKTDRLTLGLGVNAPYATGTQFDDNEVFRYQVKESEITGISFSFGAGYELTPAFSIGGTVNAQYASVVQNLDLNLSGVCQSTLGDDLALPVCGAIGLIDPSTPQNDINLNIEGDSLDFGYTLGGLYQFQTIRVGFNYRSKITHKLDAEIELTDVSLALPGGAKVGVQGINSKGQMILTTPESASLAAFWQVSPDVTLQGDFGFTRWSRFEQIPVTVDTLGLTLPIEQNWRNSRRLAFGGSYRYSPALLLRAGMAFDESPIPDSNVTVDLGLNHYKAFSVGMSYRFDRDLSLDMGLQHTMTNQRQLDQLSLAEDSRATGEITNKFNSFAMGLRWKL